MIQKNYRDCLSIGDFDQFDESYKICLLYIFSEPTYKMAYKGDANRKVNDNVQLMFRFVILVGKEK